MSGEGTARLTHCFWIALLLVGGCSKEAAESNVISEPALTRQYRQGSVTAILSVSHTNITTAGNIRLRVDIHGPKNEHITFPDMESTIDPFSISAGYTEPAEELPNGKHLYRYAWTLIPPLAGEAALLPLEITVGTETIRTDSIRIAVTSILPEGLERLEIKDLAAPVELLAESRIKRSRLLLLLGAILAAGLLSGAIYYVRRPKPEVITPPHERALLALNQLPEDKPERIHALVKILLNYIEERFRHPTSALTLNEFFPRLTDSIPMSLREELESILLTSDQIRFSSRIPPEWAAQLEAFTRRFIQETMEVPECA